MSINHFSEVTYGSNARDASVSMKHRNKRFYMLLIISWFFHCRMAFLSYLNAFVHLLSDLVLIDTCTSILWFNKHNAASL
jgi:hypothetical protein